MLSPVTTTVLSFVVVIVIELCSVSSRLCRTWLFKFHPITHGEDVAICLC